jgi:hypothetical protein
MSTDSTEYRSGGRVLGIVSAFFLLFLSVAALLSADAVKAALPASVPTGTSAADVPSVAAYADMPNCGPDWSVVPTPKGNSRANHLNGVAAVSANDVWAVGDYDVGRGETLILHWDGSAWSLVPSPNVGTDYSYLEGVAAVSANDVWAVGSYWNGSTAFQTLILHWDGRVWSVIPSPNVDTNGSIPNGNVLNGVAVVSTKDVWVAGYWSGPSGYQTLILHWDGSAWDIVPSPNQDTGDNFLKGVAAASVNDVWAVGDYGTVISQILILHWDGSVWRLVSSPNVGASFNYLYGIAAVSASDAWAVGSHYNEFNVAQMLILHWDGSVWSMIPSPNQDTGSLLNGVAAVSANDVWAVGYYWNNSSGGQTLMLHWDGSAWSAIPSPNPGANGNLLYAVTASANGVWAAGNYIGTSGTQTLVERYNPCHHLPVFCPSRTCLWAE